LKKSWFKLLPTGVTCPQGKKGRSQVTEQLKGLQERLDTQEGGGGREESSPKTSWKRSQKARRQVAFPILIATQRCSRVFSKTKGYSPEEKRRRTFPTELVISERRERENQSLGRGSQITDGTNFIIESETIGAGTPTCEGGREQQTETGA